MHNRTRKRKTEEEMISIIHSGFRRVLTCISKVECRREVNCNTYVQVPLPKCVTYKACDTKKAFQCSQCDFSCTQRGQRNLLFSSAAFIAAKKASNNNHQIADYQPAASPLWSRGRCISTAHKSSLEQNNDTPFCIPRTLQKPGTTPMDGLCKPFPRYNQYIQSAV